MRVGVAVIASVLVVCATAGAAPTWRAPVALSAPPLAVEPDLALSRDGEAVVVWDLEVGDVCASAPDNPACKHIVQARSRPGAAWELPAPVTEPGVGPGPRVAVNDAGDAIVVWRHDIGVPRVLQASWRPRTTRQWQEAVDLSDAGPIGGQDVGLDATGNAIAVWTIDLGGGMVTQAKVRPAASGSWLGQQTISRPGETVGGAPDLSVNAAGDAVAVWSRTPGVVQAAVRPAAVGAWQPAVDLGAGADPRVALDPAGNAVAVWSVPGGAVQSAYRPAGGAWSAPTDVSRAPATSARVAVDDAGNAIAVWLAGAAPHVRSAVRARATGVWSQPVNVSASGVTASDPRVAVDPAGNAVAVWRRASAPTLRAALRPASLGAWLSGVGVSGPGAVTADPLVEIDAGGHALAVWTRRGGGVSIVESAELAGDGPLLTARVIPTRAAVNRARQFSIRPVAWASPLVGQPLWNFGDGATATGRNVSHTYTTRGLFTVRVSQSDAAGHTSSATAQLRVVAVLNVTKPSIDGTPSVGNTLTCRKGTWTGVTPIQYAFRWRRNGQLIAGANAQTRVVTQADSGDLLSCSVIATNAVGSTTETSNAVRVA